VAVVGRKHPMLDEVPVACVKPASPAVLSDPAARAALVSAIEAACARELADFKRPREIIVVEDFPRSTLEKINKAALRRQLADPA